ncbi:MAG: hypothetical protein U0Z44_16555 [Kouleothrix sp.]
MGVEAGRRLADESDAFIGVTTSSLDIPAALEIYSRAYLRALIQGYRTALRQLLRDRTDSCRPTPPYPDRYTEAQSERGRPMTTPTTTMFDGLLDDDTLDTDHPRAGRCSS